MIYFYHNIPPGAFRNPNYTRIRLKQQFVPTKGAQNFSFALLCFHAEILFSRQGQKCHPLWISIYIYEFDEKKTCTEHTAFIQRLTTMPTNAKRSLAPILPISDSRIAAKTWRDFNPPFCLVFFTLLPFITAVSAFSSVSSSPL